MRRGNLAPAGVCSARGFTSVELPVGIATFVCPSGGLAGPIPVEVKRWCNITVPEYFGRSDYAASAGNRVKELSNYSINSTTHFQFGNRSDGAAVPGVAL